MKCRNRFELVKRIFEREEHWIIKLSFWVVEESLRGQKAPRWTEWRSLRVEHEEKVWRGGKETCYQCLRA